MKEDRGFRFLVGCFVIFTAYKLYTAGWFQAVSGGDESVGNADAIAIVVQAIVSAVDLVGYVAIMLVAGAWPTVKSIIQSLIGIISPEGAELTNREKLESGLLTRDEEQEIIRQVIEEVRKTQSQKKRGQ